MLDELMGADRNKRPTEMGTGGIKYHDPQVCKYYLVEFCPYLLFLNTKSDIGPCSKKYHDERLKESFIKEASLVEKEEYEFHFISFIDKLVSDLEKKLKRAKERVDIRPNDPSLGTNPENDELEERRTLLDLQVKEYLAKVEEYGEQGRIQDAEDLMAEVDKLKQEIEKLKQSEADNPLYRLDKKMEICVTCGSLLIVGDAQKRIEAHYEGKQHNGWAKIRQALIEHKAKRSVQTSHGHHYGHYGNNPSHSHSHNQHHSNNHGRYESGHGRREESNGGNGDSSRGYHYYRNRNESHRSSNKRY